MHKNASGPLRHADHPRKARGKIGGRDLGRRLDEWRMGESVVTPRAGSSPSCQRRVNMFTPDRLRGLHSADRCTVTGCVRLGPLERSHLKSKGESSPSRRDASGLTECKEGSAMPLRPRKDRQNLGRRQWKAAARLRNQRLRILSFLPLLSLLLPQPSWHHRTGTERQTCPSISRLTDPTLRAHCTSTLRRERRHQAHRGWETRRRR